MNLTGKSVVITGAARGLGASYARLAAESGARVVVSDIDKDGAAAVVEEIKASGGEAISSVGDVSDPDYAVTLVDGCVERFGSIDGLINNAGLHCLGLAWEPSDASIERTVRVNVLGAIYPGRYALKRMVEAGRGSLVNVTSGTLRGRRASSIYSSTKGAIASLTYSWALDAEGTGVRVNALSPLASSPMSEEAVEFGRASSEFAARPLSSMASPDAIAPAAVYLLSDDSAPLTGRIVRFDGEQLSLMTAPEILPLPAQDTWDVASISEAVIAAGLIATRATH